MKRLEWSSLSPSARAQALARPQRRRDPEVASTVRRIFDEVEAQGWEAVRRWARELDGCEPRQLELSAAIVDAARAKLEREDIEAIELALDQVRRAPSRLFKAWFARACGDRSRRARSTCPPALRRSSPRSSCWPNPPASRAYRTACW